MGLIPVRFLFRARTQSAHPALRNQYVSVGMFQPVPGQRIQALCHVTSVRQSAGGVIHHVCSYVTLSG